MSRTLRPARPYAGRWSPRVEGLEPRRLLTISDPVASWDPLALGPLDATTPDVGGWDDSSSLLDATATPSDGDLSTLSVVAVDPAPGSVVYRSPDVLNVTFNQPFDPISVGFDIGLQQVGPDGSVIQDLSSWLFEPFDLTGEPTTLPVQVLTTLGLGDYQVVLLGSLSMLSGIGQDGNPGAPLAASGTDQVIGTFTVADPPTVPDLAPTLAEATDLGIVGPTAVVTPGTLDLELAPGDYRLYKVTLAPGHFWRLGAEVTAQRDGGTFNAVLGLFDSEGRLLKWNDIGRPDMSLDPYLFAGLEPGTYYLGVSGAGNIPGIPGAYDPVAGVRGTVGLDQPGGPFQLHVLADAADAPTRLLSSQLKWADPLDPSPTGLTLTFSGAMDIDSFKNSVVPGPKTGSGQDLGYDIFQGIQVVDAQGKLWTLSPVEYHEADSEFTFLFNQRLPRGHYSLVVPEQGGVTDLAGLAPVTPGQPAGVLATWDVGQDLRPPIQNNLGVIRWGPGTEADGQAVLRPDTGVTYRFVAPAAGFYKLNALYSGGSLAIQLFHDDGEMTLDGGAADQPLTDLVYLDAGVYSLQFVASGSRSVRLDFTLAMMWQSYDSVFDNGVGQGPALNLTLISPSAPDSSSTPPTVPSTPSSPPVTPPSVPGVPPSVPGTPTPVQDTVPASPGVPSGPQPYSAVASSPAPTGPAVPGGSALPAATSVESSSGGPGLILTLGNTLVGSPSAVAEHVAAVGPGNQPGVTALAASTPGLLQGITYGQTIGSVSPYGGDGSLSSAVDLQVAEVSAVIPGVDEVPGPIDGALAAGGVPAEHDHDERAVAVNGWLGSIGSRLLDWFGVSAPSESWAEDLPAVDAGAEPIVLTSDGDGPRNRAEVAGSDHLQHADLATPIGLAAITVVALRLRHPARRWTRTRRGKAVRISAQATARGPHARI